MPSQITGHFSCDNSYSVWKGNATQVDGVPLLQATNTQASQIYDGEDLPPIDITPECYLYIVAWSDDATYQGLIGSFSGAITLHTGDPKWRVLPTGINKNNNQFPTSIEINAAIAAAQPNDWKIPVNGAPNGGPPWNLSVQGLSTDAHWMWYDSGKDTQPKYPSPPFVPFDGFDHDEFLIFRIPCKEFEPTMENTEKHCCVVNICQCCGEEKAKLPPPPVVIKEKSCECSSCVFEVRLQRIRYVSGKPGWLDGAAELSFTVHVDGNMYNYPTGNGSYLRVLKRGAQFSTAWIPVNVRAGIVEVPCKCPRAIDLMTEMIENPAKEKGLVAAFEGGRPWGCSEPATPILKCGTKPPPVLQVVALEHGGNRTENMKMEVEYRFSQVTACSCGCSED